MKCGLSLVSLKFWPFTSFTCWMLLFPVSLFRTLYIEGERKLDFAGWCAAIQVAAGSGGDTLSQQQLTETDIPVIVHSCISYITQCGERSVGSCSMCLAHTHIHAVSVCSCGLCCCLSVCKLGTFCVCPCVLMWLALRETARQQNISVPPPFLLLLPPCCFSSPRFCILFLPSLLILPPTFTSWPASF